MTVINYAQSTIMAIVFSPFGTKPVVSYQTSIQGALLQTPVDEEALAKQELARIMPSGARLLELAAKNPPLPEWFNEEEDAPF